MLARKYRIKQDHDFSLIYKKGRKFRGKYGMISILYPLDRFNSDALPLFGYVVSKKIGNAVVRHKYKRQLRAITFELLKDENFIKKLRGAKITFIAYKIPETFDALKKEIYELYKVSKTIS